MCLRPRHPHPADSLTNQYIMCITLCVHNYTVNPFDPKSNIGSTTFSPRALLAIFQPTLLKLFFSKSGYINEFEVVFCLSEVGRLENDVL